MNSYEERIIARGLRSPGPLLLLKKRMREIEAIRLRIIVSYRDAANEIIAFLSQRGAKCEIDSAGNEFHVIADLSNFRDAR